MACHVTGLQFIESSSAMVCLSESHQNPNHQSASREGLLIRYGRPYHPRGRGKIESYHKILYRELISQVRFKSLSHFRLELRMFDRRYNYWRKSQALGWKTPASIYNDSRYLTKSWFKMWHKLCH